MQTLKCALMLAFVELALLAQFPVPGGGTGVGGSSGAANVSATSVSAVTTLAIDVSSLNLANLNGVLVQCWAGTSAPFAPVTVTSLNPASTSSITANFSNTANVTCRVNTNGGAVGPPGATGETGAAGANGTNGTNGTDGTNGSNGAPGEVQSDESTTLDGQMVLFSGVGGETIKKGTLSGVVKATGGVPAAVTGDADDCVKVDGSSGPCGTGAISSVSGDGSGIVCSPTTGVVVCGLDGAIVPTKLKPYGVEIGDAAGSALATGVLGYVKVGDACTIVGWDILVDSGTATVDVWKVASGTAKPTVANTITASAKPTISSGTAVSSATLTGWTTSVSAGDWLGFNLDATSGPKLIYVAVRCQ